MVSGWWHRPVPVLVGSNTTQHITRPSAAADLLLHDWPAEGGAAYTMAKVAILKALENPDDDGLSDAAFEAFQEAAREAGILAG